MCLCDHMISLLAFFRDAALSTLIAGDSISLYNPQAAGKIISPNSLNRNESQTANFFKNSDIEFQNSINFKITATEDNRDNEPLVDNIGLRLPL